MVTITKLVLSNFRTHLDTSIEFGARTFFYGANAAGKSTIVDAIQWALTGQCRGLDGAGRGVAKLINDGPSAKPKKMSVAVTLYGIGTVVRSATAKSTTLAILDVPARGRLVSETRTIEGPAATVQKELYRLLGADEATVIAALDTYALIDMDHGAAKGLLLQLLGVQVEIPGALYPDGQARVVTLAELDAEEQEARNARAAAKRALADLGAEVDLPTWTGRTLEDNGGDVVRISGAIEDAAQRFGATEAAIAAKTAEAERIMKPWRWGNGAAPDSVDEARAACDAADDALRALGVPNQSQDWRAEASRLEGEIATRAAMLDRVRIGAPSGACVLSRGIACGTPAQSFADFVASEDRAIDALRESLSTVNAKAKAAQAHIDAHRAFVAASERLTRAEDYAAARASAEALRVEVDQLRDALADDPRPGLKQELARLADESRAILAYQRSVGAHRAASEKRVALQAEVERLEQLCDVLGPKGARVDALASAVTRFEARVADLLAVWGYRLRIGLDPWGFVVNDRPAALLSRSERLRVGMALQWAVSQIAGLGLVLYDDMETLDAQANKALGWFVFGPSTRGQGQVVMVATRDASYVPPLVDGLRAYHVEAGAVKAVIGVPATA